MFSVSDSVVPAAGTRATSMAAHSPALVHPVFLWNESLPALKEEDYTVVCAAAERTAGLETVEGAEKMIIIMGNLWRPISGEPRALTKADKIIHFKTHTRHTHTHMHTAKNKHSSHGFDGNRRKKVINQ